MKRTKYYILSICIILALACSCSKEQDEIVEPDYNFLQDINENSSDDSKTDKNVEENATSNDNTIAQISPVTQENLPKNIDNSITNAPISEPYESEKNDNMKEWSYPLEFEGAGDELQAARYGNIDANYKGFQVDSFILCPDEINNCAYFINYSEDNNIYQLKDGVCSLLIDKEAQCLQLWNNELYFIENKIVDSQVMDYGNIFSYNLNTKEIRLVVEANAFIFYINSRGIYYQDMDITNNSITGYRLGFDKKAPIETGYYFYYSYSDYEINDSKGDTISLYNKKTGIHTDLAPIDYFDRIRIFDKYFTFKKGTCIYILDLITGEKKIYDLNDCKQLIFKMNSINDYIIFNNYIYASAGFANYIMQVNLVTGEISYKKLPGETLWFGNLLIGNNKLYVMCSEENVYSDNRKLVELNLDGAQIIVKEIEN